MSEEKITFEQALLELENVVKKLDSGVSLEESIVLYEKGLHLRKMCENILNAAKLKIEEINNKDN